MAKQGKIKISSENMMPIIKKWLYSDKDIFLREIVANGVDAITKHKKLVDMGEAQSNGAEYKISVTVDEKAKTLTVEDNGIGMTLEEIGDRFGLTRERVRQIREKAIRKLRVANKESILRSYLG